MVNLLLFLLKTWYWVLYYMTRERINAKGEGMIFADVDEVHRAYDNAVVNYMHKLKFVLRHQLMNTGDQTTHQLVETTVGRALLWQIIT